MRNPLLVLSLLSITALAAPAEAQSFVVTIDEARLYQRATVYAETMTDIPLGTIAELIGCRASWCEVRLNDVRGFLQQRAVAVTDRRPAPIPPSVERAPAAEVASAEHEDRRAEAERASPAAPPTAQTMAAPPSAPVRSGSAPAREVQAAERIVTSSPAQATPSLAPLSSLPAATPPAPSAPVPSVEREEPAPVEDAVAEDAPIAANPRRVTAPAAPAPSPRPPTRSRLKDPATGRLASFLLPGGGHLYAGETGVGTSFLLLSVAAPTVGYLASDRTVGPNCASLRPGTCTDTANYGPLLVGVAVAATAWVAGLLDAEAAVRRSNGRVANGRTGTDMSVRPVTKAGYAGLSLRVTL